ncbi:MAG TPA: biotin--[acetyl-CoA-carboxylase] ligase [Oscillospiraceae bacterium]|nr:biotin--[acetyl-CoA-carboxylase] ligase [Oscillospiraceae bacterium]
MRREEIIGFFNKDRGGPLFYYESLESTNSLAGDLILSNPADGTVIVAGEQSRGQGRLGRTFFSPPGSGIYLSYIKLLPAGAKNLGLLTGFAALAVCEAIEAKTNHRTQIKWPNDILINRKKVCGILTKAHTVPGESEHNSYALIGIGLNVNRPQEGFPKDIVHKAGSLRAEGEEALNRFELCALIIENLYRILIEEDALIADAGARLAALRERSCVIGKEVMTGTQDKREKFLVLDLAADGGLLVTDKAGEQRIIYGGEILEVY